MTELWLVIGFICVPIVLGKVIRHGHRRCCGRQRRVRLEGTVTVRRLP
jgi:hypothetical protein